MRSMRSAQLEELSQFLSVVDEHMITSMTDVNGVIQDVSEAFCKISGYSRDELIGQPQSIVRHPDSSPDTFKELWKTIKAGEQWQGELKNRSKDGSAYWVITTIFPRFDTQNNTIGYISLRQDITASKQLRQQEKILQEQSKNAAMGEMIGLIAHQWAQPLTTISAIGAGVEVQMELDVLEEEDLRNAFLSINKNVKYLSDTISDFKNFFKNADNLVEASISDVLKYSFSIINPLVRDNHISLVYDPMIIQNNTDNKIMTVYKNDLTQVILNLIKNSIDALIQNKVQDPCIEIKLTKKDDNYLLEVSDNAGGIPKEHLVQIFESDFSTKGDKGTGLGLYMSKMIVEKHLHGTIEVHNNGTGACFHISLPAVS